MVICYAGRSSPSALRIAEQGDITAVRSNVGDINWGVARANTSLNPDISNATNKRRMRELFAEQGVPMPKLYTAEEVRRSIVCHQYKTFVGRPDTHMKGRGFWKISTLKQLNRALRGITWRSGKRKKAATHFMKYVEAPREYRVHIFKGRSIRISEKDFDEDGDYTTAKPQHNVEHVRDAAKKAVKAVGLDFGAVDILANDNQCWVLEVNSAPGLGGSMPRVYARAFKKHMEGEW